MAFGKSAVEGVERLKTHKLSNFYKNKSVFVTGHTGFKGTWLCKALSMAGARVTGYALSPPTNPSLFEIVKTKRDITSITGDVRDLKALYETVKKAEPEIVFHLAAQPIVLEGYRNPVYTYETNVMGTVNLLECIRNTESVKSLLNVTTDKVYLNREWIWGYRETDELNGFDPYSNSKSCSELVSDSYKRSFFCQRQTAISTARAGNVIGGGDFAADRIIPDCVRAVSSGRAVIVRNSASERPFQHVLEPIFAYMTIAAEQSKNPQRAGAYNIGPDYNDCVTAGQIAEVFCNEWGNGAKWETYSDGACAPAGPHEARLLKLDCSKIEEVFGIKPVWNIKTAVRKTVEWTKEYLNGTGAVKCMEEQISDFENLFFEKVGRNV